MANCIFCKIVAKQVPADVLFEDDTVMAFRDINPVAPVHILVIPKRHIGSLAEAEDEHQSLLGKLLLHANKVAQEAGLSGYRVAINVGKEGGQVVPHLHVHVIGGRSADDLPALG
jgi:histidine triad (HIT) family protein